MRKAVAVIGAAAFAAIMFAVAGGTASTATSGTWFGCASKTTNSITVLRFGTPPACGSTQYLVATGDGTPTSSTSTTTTTPVVTTTTAARSTTTTAPHATTTTTTPVPAGGYVTPGSVGYLGSSDALTVYDPNSTNPFGTWQSYGLRITADTLTLDHVRINGPVYWSGNGTLTITNSIVDTTNFAGVAVGAHGTGSIVATDSTFTGVAPAGWDVAAIWPSPTGLLTVNRDAFSGFPQGVDAWTDGSSIKNSWIRTAVNGAAHMDGIFLQGGNNIEIAGNFIDGTPTNGNTVVTAGIFFQNYHVAGPSMANISVHDNFVDMYGYPTAFLALRNQSGLAVNVVNNVFGNRQLAVAEVQPTYGPAGTFGTFTGNVHVDGTAVPTP